MALEKLYTVKEIAEYFGVTESTVLRWIGAENKEPGTGLKARMIAGKYRARESWIKQYARVLYGEESA
jgi:excisionase family DNA binding protein